jgi:hypothetical protein
MKKLILALSIVLSFGAHAADVVQNNSATRSKLTVYKFRSSHPCPGNGSVHGACPGYVVDHIQALECGGLDSPTNMQWQTVADGKAKDKIENLCKKGKK